MSKEAADFRKHQTAQPYNSSRRRFLRFCGLSTAILASPFIGNLIPVEAAGPEPTVHTVKKGETLSGLAEHYLRDKNQWPDIARTNELENPNLIFPGQRLIIPNSDIIPNRQESSERKSSLIQNLAPIYLISAERNIVPSSRGEVIIPSQPYRNGIYCRDAFWATLGLDNLSLMKNCYRWFAETQLNHGQIRSAVPFNPEDQSLQPQNDESTLLFLLWSGILKKKGVSVDIDAAFKALGFVRDHIEGGYYLSPPGPFRYWLDTLSCNQTSRISYNQGLWALALRAAREIGINIPEEEISLAKRAYQSCYRLDLGLVTQSKETIWQDTSSLLPEFLSGSFFSEKILDDEMVVSTVNQHLKTAGVYQGGKLVGIKNISYPNGSFLSPGFFAIRHSEKGDYQNGGYWPMYTLIELSLAYKITKNQKYQEVIAQLMEIELKDGRGAKEFLSLAPGRIGSYPKETAGYSWNALVYPALRWSGLL